MCVPSFSYEKLAAISNADILVGQTNCLSAMDGSVNNCTRVFDGDKNSQQQNRTDAVLLPCSLTLAGARKPAKLMEYLRKTPGRRVEKTAEGMYYVYGEQFPIQIVETRRRKNDIRVIFASLVFLAKN